MGPFCTFCGKPAGFLPSENWVSSDQETIPDDRPHLAQSYPLAFPPTSTPRSTRPRGVDGGGLPAICRPVAYSFMGKDISYADRSLSQALAPICRGWAWSKGDRVAVMMPNVPQYPVAVAAILRAGFVVVNVNPLYTRASWSTSSRTRAPGHRHHRELRDHAAAVHCAHARQARGAVRHGRPAGLAQGRAGQLRGAQRQENGAAFNLPGAVRFNEAIAQGRAGTPQSRTSSLTISPCCSTPAAPPA